MELYLYMVAQIFQTWANMLFYLVMQFREIQVEENASSSFNSIFCSVWSESASTYLIKSSIVFAAAIQ